MQEFEILFYDKPDGTEPVREFLDSLDVKMRAKMLRTIQLLAVNGTELREPYSKPLEDGIFELRAKVGSDISRVLYFFVIGRRVILTNGFIKKAQRLRQAKKNWPNDTVWSTSVERSIEMTNFKEYLKEQMSDPAFKQEWDALEPEFSIVQALIDARKESGLTQKQLSERTGIAQADISKLESGNGNPSVKTLQRLAAGMGMRVKIEFQPVGNP